MSTEPTEREDVTEPRPRQPHVGPPSLAANTVPAYAEAAARPLRHRAPAQVAGVVLPARAPWVAVLGAAAVMLAVSLVTGFDPGLFVVGTALLGGVAVYAWSRSVEGPRRATDRGVTYAIVTAFLL